MYICVDFFGWKRKGCIGIPLHATCLHLKGAQRQHAHFHRSRLVLSNSLPGRRSPYLAVAQAVSHTLPREVLFSSHAHAQKKKTGEMAFPSLHVTVLYVYEHTLYFS